MVTVPETFGYLLFSWRIENMIEDSYCIHLKKHLFVLRLNKPTEHCIIANICVAICSLQIPLIYIYHTKSLRQLPTIF